MLLSDFSDGILGCHSRGLPSFVWTGPVRAIETQFFATKVHQVMNRKFVELTNLYNFHKGSRVFFSTDFAGTSCQL
jgi:hypothetical protein